MSDDSEITSSLAIEQDVELYSDASQGNPRLQQNIAKEFSHQTVHIFVQPMEETTQGAAGPDELVAGLLKVPKTVKS